MGSLWIIRTVRAAICAILLVFPAMSQAVEVSPAEIANRRCFGCHAQHEIGERSIKDRLVMVRPATEPVAEPEGPRPGLWVTTESLARSVHAKLACVDCHTQAASLPHPQQMRPINCDASCHTTANSDYLQGAHAEAAARGDGKAPTCATCHGGHDILPKHDRNSRTFPLNIVKVCGDCHKQHTSPDGRDGPEHIQHYLDSVHGRAVASGLSVAATCADCHSNHRVLPAKDAKSTVHRDNIPQTCGRCHTGVSEVFMTSVHGQEISKGDMKAPVCSDCHTAHAITRTDTPAFKLDIVNECGQCHDKPIPDSPTKLTLYESYRESYHGQVTRLGFERAARCSSCHGSHDIKRVSDPSSRLAGENRIETCRRCHQGADAKFALYQAHADPTNRHRSPVLFGVRWYFIIMMSAAFGFFGLHSVMWFARSLVERIRHGPPPVHNPGSDVAIKRFNRVDRVNHAFVIISFFGLTLTGLPLLYADKAWGLKLATMLGGPNSCGILHRCFAIMLIGNFVVHGAGVVRRFKRLGLKDMLIGPVTMLPRWKDITDCAGMWKWFFVGGAKPKFDRWTYWEKFDYIAEVGGSAIIGITGLFLWFPVFFSHYMPGWMFNVAQYIHGYEALLAIGFIFTVHFFNAHLRMEKFPVDDVIFTGRLPEEEFKHERPAEYERLVAQGKLEALKVKPPSKGYRVFAVIIGTVAMAVGTTLVVLIILAGLKWI
jgi:cytochrome b subunit of formate dehydrogenase